MKHPRSITTRSHFLVKLQKKYLIPDFPPIPHPFTKFPQFLHLPHRPFFGRKCDEYPHLTFPLSITKNALLLPPLPNALHSTSPQLDYRSVAVLSVGMVSVGRMRDRECWVDEPTRPRPPLTLVCTEDVEKMGRKR